MNTKRFVSILAMLALCLALLAACETQKEVNMDEEEDYASSLIIPETEVEPGTETESESQPEVIVESESEPVSEPESESESESATAEPEVESDFTKEVRYAARIDGFDINQGKLTLTMCEVPDGVGSNKLTADDFTPKSETRTLILPDNTKVMLVNAAQVSGATMEEIITGIFTVLEGDENYMELYLYME